MLLRIAPVAGGYGLRRIGRRLQATTALTDRPLLPANRERRGDNEQLHSRASALDCRKKSLFRPRRKRRGWDDNRPIAKMLRPFHYAGAQRQIPSQSTAAEPPPTASRQRHRRATSVSSPLSTSYPAVSSESATLTASAGGLPTAASALLLATRTRTTSSTSRSRSTSTGNHRTKMGTGTGVKPDQSILVENHGAGTHFVCRDELGGLGPTDPLIDFDEVRTGRTVDHQS